MRAIRIRTKMNGDKNYDVISWEKTPTVNYPEKPIPPCISKEAPPINLLSMQM